MPKNDAKDDLELTRAGVVSGTGNQGSEVKADAQRDDDKPKYGGEQWDVAAERGDKRFGHARNDDADPSTMTKGAGGGADNNDDEGVRTADPELQAAEQNQEIESGGQRAGMGRGEEPRKPKSQS